MLRFGAGGQVRSVGSVRKPEWRQQEAGGADRELEQAWDVELDQIWGRKVGCVDTLLPLTL